MHLQGKILIFSMRISVSSLLNIMTTMTSCFIFLKRKLVCLHIARLLPIQILVSPSCNITQRYSTTDVRVHHETLSLVTLNPVHILTTCFSVIYILILFSHLLSLSEDFVTNILYAFILLLS